MLNDITIGQYIPGDSVVHRLDPRIKLLLALFFIVIIFVVDSFWMYLVLFLYIAGVAMLAKVRASYMLRSLKPLIFIIAFTFLMNVLLMRTGRVLVEFWIIKITTDGLLYAVRLSVRLMLLVFATTLLTLSTSPLSLTDALERLLKPLRAIGFPAHELAMMMTIALRFIPTLLEETDRIMKAQKSRGADFESGGLMKRAKALVPILIPLFVGAFRRADELALAMESRCYHGGNGRTRMRVLKLSRNDLFAVLTGAALLALAIFEKKLFMPL